MEVSERGYAILKDMNDPTDNVYNGNVELPFESPGTLSTETKDRLFRTMEGNLNKCGPQRRRETGVRS